MEIGTEEVIFSKKRLYIEPFKIQRKKCVARFVIYLCPPIYAQPT